ncbi:MAG TPA: CoA transferase [Anaerolineae bacterium]|nr:CoA transferase [Anaerolineae bacterium]
MQSILDNITVVDLTQALAGPYCTMMLGDLGADVVKIERPPKGDQSRGWGPPFLAGESAYFLSTNRNKRGMTLNLKEPAAREIMHRLIERADVFVTNLPRQSSRRANGVDWETLHALNPRLVYCSITGYGMTGPYAERGGYDVIAQGESGLMSLTGEVDGDPIRYPIPIADVTTGIYSAFAIVAALLAREKTGEGQFLDMALLDSQISWLTNVAGNYFATGERPPRLGNAHPTIVPYQPFRARDKHFIVGVGSERLWKKFCAVLGMADTLADDPRFATNSDRLAHRQELIALLEEIFVREDADVWVERFGTAGIPCGPINFVDEALAHPQALHRGVIVQLEHPLIGVVRSLGNPMHFSHTPTIYRLPPPMLGQHTDRVLRELGYDEQGIRKLRERGAV